MITDKSAAMKAITNISNDLSKTTAKNTTKSAHSALLACFMYSVFNFVVVTITNKVIMVIYLLESPYWWFRNCGQELGSWVDV